MDGCIRYTQNSIHGLYIQSRSLVIVYLLSSPRYDSFPMLLRLRHLDSALSTFTFTFTIVPRAHLHTALDNESSVSSHTHFLPLPITQFLRRIAFDLISSRRKRSSSSSSHSSSIAPSYSRFRSPASTMAGANNNTPPYPALWVGGQRRKLVRRNRLNAGPPRSSTMPVLNPGSATASLVSSISSAGSTFVNDRQSEDSFDRHMRSTIQESEESGDTMQFYPPAGGVK